MIIRANADTPEQVSAAQKLGASGIGLCRTEPMLLRPESFRLMQTVASASSEGARNTALSALLPLHQASFEAIFRVSSEQPVCIRPLDPPLHSFLPSLVEIDRELMDARTNEDWDEVVYLSDLRCHKDATPSSHSALGHRGARLSLTHPEILRMQVTAILQASLSAQAEGIDVNPAIVIPMVASVRETAALAKIVGQIGSEIFSREKRFVNYRLGALIETPRAALCAEGIAEHLDFVCFGTNDLTQMTFGFSREDAGAYLTYSLELEIYERNPFVCLDREGVGYLLALAISNIRRGRPDFEVGVCGDHATDPESLSFFKSLGVSFVSVHSLSSRAQARLSPNY